MNKLYSSLVDLNEKKLALAIQRLEAICSPEGKEIIHCLSEFNGLPFIDILIKTQLEQEMLQIQLKKLLAAGILRMEHNFYTAEYYLNGHKLGRIQDLCKVLVKDLPLAA